MTADHPADRDRAMARRAEAGESLSAIARDYGVSRERARQIVARTSTFTPEQLRQARADHRAEARGQRAAARAAQIRQTAADDHEATVSDLAERCTTSPGEVEAALGWMEAARRATGRSMPSTPPEQILTEMRRVAALHPNEPLGGPFYDRHQTVGVTQGRIIQRFGTWTAACHAAGVPAPPPARPSYTRTWTREEMSRWVWDYLTTTEHPTYAGLEQWLRDQDGAPSAQTIRNEIGSWATMRRVAAEQHRPTDAADPTEKAT